MSDRLVGQRREQWIRLPVDTPAGGWRAWGERLADQLPPAGTLQVSCGDQSPLEVGCLAALRQCRRGWISSGRSWQWQDLDPAVSCAFDFLGLHRSDAPTGLPFVGRPRFDDAIDVVFQPSGGVAFDLLIALAWLPGVRFDRLEVDVGKLDHFTSQIINWLLKIRANGVQVHLLRPNNRVITVIEQMRLDRLFRLTREVRPTEAPQIDQQG